MGMSGGLAERGRSRIDADVGRVGGQGDDAGAVQEVAEAFAVFASGGVAREQRVERFDDLGLGDVLAVQRVQPLAAVVGAFAPLRNIDAWYAAFGIKEGDPLYIASEDRVRIW